MIEASARVVFDVLRALVHVVHVVRALHVYVPEGHGLDVLVDHCVVCVAMPPCTWCA